MNIDINKVINPHYIPLLANSSRYLVLRGSASSGKSYFIAQKYVLRILADWSTQTHRFLCLRKTAPFARRSLYKLFRDIISEWNLWDIVHVNSTFMTFTFANGSEIECTGLDDSEKLKSIHGVTGMWFEEATEFPLQDFRIASTRMRGHIDSYYQTCLSFNPVSKLKWVYKEFYDEGNPYRRVDDVTLHFSTYTDNLWNDEGIIKELEAYEHLDYNFYRVMTLGEWGSLDNLIFNHHKIVPAFPDDVEEIWCGLDFGYTHPMAIVKVGKTKEGLYVQQMIHRRQLNASGLIDKMNRMFPTNVEWAPNVLHRQTPIYCDSSRPEMISELRMKGFNTISASKGKNSVTDGIDLLKRNSIFITKDSVDLINEFNTYKWKEDRDGKVYDEPVKLFDDGIDALRYAVYMRMRKNSELNFLFMKM